MFRAIREGLRAKLGHTKHAGGCCGNASGLRAGAGGRKPNTSGERRFATDQFGNACVWAFGGLFLTIYRNNTENMSGGRVPNVATDAYLQKNAQNVCARACGMQFSSLGGRCPNMGRCGPTTAVLEVPLQ